MKMKMKKINKFRFVVHVRRKKLKETERNWKKLKETERNWMRLNEADLTWCVNVYAILFDPVILWFFDSLILWFFDSLILSSIRRSVMWLFESLSRWFFDSLIIWLFDYLIIWLFGRLTCQIIIITSVQSGRRRFRPNKARHITADKAIQEQISRLRHLRLQYFRLSGDVEVMNTKHNHLLKIERIKLRLWNIDLILMITKVCDGNMYVFRKRDETRLFQISWFGYYKFEIWHLIR
jgi:hypothetical protein